MGEGSTLIVAVTGSGRIAHMSVLTDAVRTALTGGHVAHLVTVDPDGSPQISAVWIGLDGDEIVSGHLADRQKLRNVRRDPRVALSLETGVVNDFGLAEYLVVRGTARVEEGDAAALLQRLAHVYLGPDVVFPPGTDHPPGLILRITPERIGGVGPWAG
jgi:PPOX class probable F420-dependent enzyme